MHASKTIGLPASQLSYSTYKHFKPHCKHAATACLQLLRGSCSTPAVFASVSSQQCRLLTHMWCR